MANVKISELAAATDITGTEQVPVVQGGTTKRTTAAAIVAPHEADSTSVHGIANTASLATQAYVTAAIDALVTGAPGALDTLNELAAAINDDASFAATVTAALAAKASTDALNTHAADTSSVHGVTDTAALLTEPTHDALDHAGVPGVGGIALSLIDAAADLLVGSGPDAVARLAKGAGLDVLRVNAGATALEWAAPSGTSGMVDQDVKRRTSGDLTLGSTTWANLDTGLDIVLTAAIGDVVEVSLSGLAASVANPIQLEVMTIVAAAPVNGFGSGELTTTTGGGILAWYATGSTLKPVGGSVSRVLVGGDISAGTVTLRLRYRTDTATPTRTFYASATNVLQFAARNFGPIV